MKHKTSQMQFTTLSLSISHSWSGAADESLPQSVPESSKASWISCKATSDTLLATLAWSSFRLKPVLLSHHIKVTGVKVDSHLSSDKYISSIC